MTGPRASRGERMRELSRHAPLEQARVQAELLASRPKEREPNWSSTRSLGWTVLQLLDSGQR